ncbi:hypothetical protein R1flu_019629 [Riccia fluitans]|uniref:SWIM-type domain-containing protein n=1 Tax=Riccia fluitans TaxID=41844 RepID=A0ABD1ZLC8_9MARC
MCGCRLGRIRITHSKCLRVFIRLGIRLICRHLIALSMGLITLEGGWSCDPGDIVKPFGRACTITDHR